MADARLFPAVWQGVVLAFPVRRFAAVCVLFSFLGACSSTTSVGELNYAIMNEDMTAVRAGIDNGANVNGRNGSRETTPLHTAAIQGNVAMVRTLVEAGAEVEIADCGGKTALIYAAETGSVAVARYLVEHGANVNRRAGEVNITCEHGHPEDTALTVAAQNNRADFVRFLLKNDAKAGGKRAYAYALADPAREPVARQLKAAGYRADEETARLVAELSASGGSPAASQPAQQAATRAAANESDDDDGYDMGDAALDAAAVGGVLSILGAF